MRRTLAILALLAGTAHAEPRARFLLDGVVGLGVPIADSDYTNASLLSPRFGLRLGAEIKLAPRFALAPEAAIDGGPIVPRSSSSPTTGRLRFEAGARALFVFGRGHAFFLRWVLGGETFIYGPGARLGAGQMNTGFATEPGVGMQFRIARRAVAGFLLGVPLALHSFGNVTSLDADFDVTGFVGLRL